METKFIGLEGFNEIENLSTTKKAVKLQPKKISTAQKTVRFVKRAMALTAKSISRKKVVLFGKIAERKAAKAALPAQPKVNKPQASLIEKCYRENRNGIQSEFASSAREAISNIKSNGGKKFAHSAPAVKSTHPILRKKAVLATVACFVAVTMSCMTVASALDFANNGGNNTSGVSTVDEADKAPESNSVLTTYSAGTSTSDEAMSSLASSACITITKGLITDNLQTSCAGLYIDGEFIGATAEVSTLNAALEKVLSDYREGYDDATTTEFANNVEVKNGKFTDSEIMSVDDIMSKADGRFSIALSTDIVYDKEIEYDTTYEEDDSESTSYEKTKTEGENGTATVTMRTTYTDGVQTDAYETARDVTKEPVNEVIVKGTKESSSSSSSSSSSGSGSSSGNFNWPMPYTHNITSYFEWRWGRMHNGIDISAGGINGQAITAADGGTVTLAGNLGDGYGNYVIIDHGNGYQTLYAHCSSLAVSQGQSVSQGQTIAYVGSTGNSTGPHLHFEIRQGSEKLNPLNFVG